MLTADNPGPIPESIIYRSQSLDLHYLDWGNAHLPTLILLHGIQDHAHSWDAVATALCSDWHVIAPDMRGHGDSAWSPDGAYLAPYILLDLVELIEILQVDQVSLIAHSFGGNAAVRFTALYPERVTRLVLVDAMGPPKAAIDMWEEQGVIARTRTWLERQRIARNKDKRIASVSDAADRLRRGNSGLTIEQARHLAMHGLRRVDDGYVWKHDPVLTNFMPEDFAVHLREFWQAITTATLICWGTKAWTPNPAIDGSADLFSNVINASFENAGHWLHHDMPEEFTARLAQFLVAN